MTTNVDLEDIDMEDMHNSFIAETQALESVVDWLRFSISQMQRQHVYYGHGTDNSWDEAMHLVLAALELPLTLSDKQIRLLSKGKVTKKESETLRAWIWQRAYQQVPLPYITHTAWFAEKPFYVDERVLIPRSPFAELIDKNFKPYLEKQFMPMSILDMCTGSGCIAIALAIQYQGATVDAVDIDTDALDVASLNVTNYQLEDRVYPIQSNVFDALSGQKYDLIIANPPYVDAEDMADLPEEYHHEPVNALASGDDGLDLTVEIVKEAAEHLNDNGWLFVEVGNSEVHFAQRFGSLEVSWCKLRRGGSGIFAISKQQLIDQLDEIENLQ